MLEIGNWTTKLQWKIVNSHKLYKVMIFAIITTNKLDRLQKTEKYRLKTSYEENFKR